MRFGAALDLWHKGDLHIEEEPLTPTEQFVSKASEKGVTPTAGAMENFIEDEQKFITELAAQVSEAVAFDVREAIRLLDERHLATEEKVAIWSLLPSKVRSAIKKEKESIKQIEIAGQY
jgi:hypothetical protein